MKLIRKISAILLFLAVGGLATPALAASNALPDLAGSGLAARAAKAQETLKKDAICTRCHDETEVAPVLSIYQTKHGVRGDARAPGCQSCHGESNLHATQEQNRPPPDISFRKGGAYKASHNKARAQACLNCHEGGARAHWDGGRHDKSGLACNDCHQVHQPKDPVLAKATQGEACFACHKSQRAEMHRTSVHDSTKVGCSDCHNPHGSVGEKLVKRNNINETCYSCHAEKRGPFLWQHAPANDSCMNCHAPHGSTAAPLMKVRGPWLCQRCHAEIAGHAGNIYSGAQLPGSPIVGNNPPPQVALRGCVNCHQQIHGSNHPGGRSYLR